MAELHEIVGSYTPLERKGQEWHGVCPLETHAEPLAVIGKRVRCFGCGFDGNALQFLTALGMDEAEAGDALSNGRIWSPTLTLPTPPPNRYAIARCLERPEATVLITQHRRAAKVAEAHLPAYCCVAWPDGGERWGGLEPLRGRTVLLWPSAEGLDDMLRLEAVLADPSGLGCTGKIIAPGDFDLAAYEGTQDDLIAWAKAHVRPLRAPAIPNPAAQDGAEVAPSSSLVPPPPVAAGPLTEAQGERSEPPTYHDDPPPVGALERPQNDSDDEDAQLPVEMGEDQLALRFASQHGLDWRYVKRWNRWFRYDGDGWREDASEEIDRLAVEFCRQAVHWPEAKLLTPEGRRRIAQRRTAGQVRDLARHDRRIAATVDQWDADPLLIGVPGGVFCVESGKVIEGAREHYVTKRCALAPASGTPKRWLEHLHRMMEGDDSMINFMQLYAGYCATGDVSQQCFAFLYGMGQTGKGTFLLTLGELLGDYAVFSEASTFLKRQGDKHLSELARFNNARLVIIDEVPSGSVWNEERIKRCTGGGKLTVNFMHSDPFDMQIKFKLAVAGNSKPQLRRVGKEMQRRIRLVKCNAMVPDDQVDQHFRQKMIANEGAQIINWIFEGAQRWRSEGLPMPEGISDATREYLDGEDAIGDWLSENATQEGETRRPDAYANFKAWFLKQGNDHAWSPQAWWSAMEDRGYTLRRSATDRFVRGLGLKIGANL